MTDTVVPGPVVLRSGRLVGRAADLEALERLVDDGDARLVTLTGPVGVGKSRLAAEVELRTSQRGEAVVHVALGAVTDAGLAGDAVIGAACDGFEASTPAQALWRRGEGAPVLLVLDDADAVDALGDLVLDLLESYPALTVLATSVRPLRVRDERVLALKPFATTDAAVELFAARASAADASFRLDDSNRAAVEQVCTAVGGLPLAIELAAARVAAVPPAAMAAQLGRSLDVLHQDPASGVPDRHRSVDTALDWSMGLLSAAAQTVLAQLTVFEGAFPLDAAMQVVDPRRAEPELLDVMSELVDSHLVDLDTTPSGVAEFRLEPLVRRHARQRLLGSGDGARARDAHADYWSTQCLLDPATASRSWPDVLAALDHRVAKGQLDEAMQLAVVASSDLGSSPGAEASLLPLVESVLGDEAVSDDALAARSLMWATVHAPAGETGAAAYGAWTARRLRRSIELARSSGDDATLLEALELSVNTLGVTFDLEGAIASAHEGLALASRRGDEAALARFEIYAAMAYGATGQPVEHARSARSAYERGTRVGEDIAVIHGALMLYPLPPDEQGPVPLLDLDELLVLAERVRRPTLTMHVLAARSLQSAAAGDDAGALAAVGRMLLIADGIERTWPMANVAPLMLLVPLALRRGAVEDAVVVRESMVSIEHLLPSIVPSMAPAYLAAATSLPSLVAPDRYEELAASVRGSTLRQSNRRAQAIVRSYLPAPAAVAPQDATATQSAVATPSLTPRERDVMQQLIAGGTNREIGEALGMTPKTVMHHTVAIYRKLGVRGRAEAVAWALRSGQA